jgi:beta-fructofuranosidase
MTMSTTRTRRAPCVVMLLALLAMAPAALFAQADDPLEKEMRAAKAALEAAIPRAAKDATRPMYHFRPPARWMNDICGAIYYKGRHHVFYQSNPYLDDEYGWGWGHARSKDLVHWEEMPFALPPMKHRGERRCNSGCVTLDGNGRPMIFYTFVPATRAKRSQWGVVPLDDELIRWRRVGDAPLMQAGKDGVPADIPGGWSDPYVFKKDGRTFVTFKACGGAVCEAKNKALTEWRYIGKLEGVTGECPNVFQLRDKWVIIRSTHPISYVTGKLVLNGDDIRFDVDGPANVVDFGYGKDKPAGRSRHCRGLYGTNTYLDDRGRRIMFGWISGFKTGRGWNGCMSLPRVLTLDRSGRLVQTPAPELKELRGKHARTADVVIDSEFKLIDGMAGNQLELIAELLPGDATAFGLKLRSSGDGSNAITLRYSGGTLNVAGTEVPVNVGDGTKLLKLHIFLDRTVMEVFINDGRQAVTRVEYPGEEDLGIGVFAEGGKATLKSLDVWQMKSIW